MSVTISSHANPATQQPQRAGAMLPPHAPMTMPKQVLSAPPGSLMRSLRSLLWAVAPGLRRLG